MDSLDLHSFFGRQRRQHAWGTHDADWGTAMMNHYQTHLGGGFTSTSPSETTKYIPRILHFIWLGPRPMPNEAILQTWQQHHGSWELRVWGNGNIPTNLQNLDAFQYALQHNLHGMASDILRCEILYQFGGVYVDIDYICIAPLTPFEHLEFYAGASNVGCIEVNNGFLAARPQSPVVKLAMDDIHAWFEANGRPLLLVSSFMGGGASAACLLNDQDICRHTGPGLWTRTLGNLFAQQQEPLRESIVIFPYQTFHPMPNTDRDVDQTFEEIVERYAVRNTTKAIHLWHGSWQNGGNNQEEQELH
jgi:hypothetical protein